MLKAKRKQLAFSLIEVMVAVAILGIIVTIALPNYQKHIQKTRRVDAANALMRLQAEQEKYYLDNNTYMTNSGPNSFTTLNKWFESVGGDIRSERGYYSITVTQDNGRPFTESFLATASVVTNGAQVRDEDCYSLSINGSGQRTAKKKGGAANDTDCWK